MHSAQALRPHNRGEASSSKEDPMTEPIPVESIFAETEPEPTEPEPPSDESSDGEWED